jgi:hypothetical protein
MSPHRDLHVSLRCQLYSPERTIPCSKDRNSVFSSWLSYTSVR